MFVTEKKMDGAELLYERSNSIDNSIKKSNNNYCQ